MASYWGGGAAYPASQTHSSLTHTRYFWDYDNVQKPYKIKSILDAIEMLKTRFGNGTFYIVGNDQLHNIGFSLNALMDVKFVNSHGGNKHDEMLIDGIEENKNWRNGDTIVLLSGDHHFRVPMEKLRDMGVKTIVVYREVG
uniref:NYN domain-containing protein n=1 Tax=Plectus sambesii TaxID=2011161 RepID=A0A914UM39_9BILA